MKVTTPPCISCGETSEVEVDSNRYQAWQAGTLIQNAFPAFTADERELLMTGTHPACWNAMFPE